MTFLSGGYFIFACQKDTASTINKDVTPLVSSFASKEILPDQNPSRQ